MAGKTDTIKQRRVDVYAPTIESKERWQKAAQEKHIPLSKYAGQILEVYLGEENADLQSELRDARRHIVDVEAENTELVRRLQDAEMLRERLESELETYRAKEMLSTSPIKKLDARLVTAFSDARGHDGRLRAVTTQELHKKLRIQKRDVERLQALNWQLEVLETHGMIVPSGKGWTWNG